MNSKSLSYLKKEIRLSSKVIKEKVSEGDSKTINPEHLFVPYDFRTMLEFIDLKIKRENAIKKIQNDDAKNTDVNFK